MKLYKLESSNWEAFFGTPEERIERDIVRLAQTPSCDAFLYLSNETHDELELLDSVPAGFDFTYCQEWGLTIDDNVVDRVIMDLRKKSYPSVQDLVVALYDTEDKAAIEAKRAEVKAKYPK